jgi:hypothetical protein
MTGYPIRGIVNHIKFTVVTDHEVLIWKPAGIPSYDFDARGRLVVRYLMDEGFMEKGRCDVKIMSD